MAITTRPVVLEAASQEFVDATSTPPFIYELTPAEARKVLDDVQAGAHPQVERVAQDDLRTHFFERARHHALDGAVRANRHEDGGFDHAVVERQAAAAGEAVGLQEFEGQHLWSSMASP